MQGEERCKSCGMLISPEKVLLQAEEHRISLALSKPPTFLDKLFSRWRHSKNPIVRVSFYVSYAILLTYATILAFFLWMIAATPG